MSKIKNGNCKMVTPSSKSMWQSLILDVMKAHKKMCPLEKKIRNHFHSIIYNLGKSYHCHHRQKKIWKVFIRTSVGISSSVGIGKGNRRYIPAATHVGNLTCQENTIILFHHIRYLECKVTNLSTSRITVTLSNCKIKDIIHKEMTERHIVDAN